MMSATVILLGVAGIIVLCAQGSQAARKRFISYDKNKIVFNNFEHWKPIQRAISTLDLDLMESNGASFDPEFVVLSRCDYASGFCRGHGSDNGNCLIEEIGSMEPVVVAFKNKNTNQSVHVELKNHTKCICGPCQSDQSNTWHKIVQK